MPSVIAHHCFEIVISVPNGVSDRAASLAKSFRLSVLRAKICSVLELRFL